LRSRAERRDAHATAGGHRQISECARQIVDVLLPKQVCPFRRQHDALCRGRLHDRERNLLADGDAGIAPRDAVDLHQLTAAHVPE